MENGQTDHQAPPKPTALCPLCQSEIAEDAKFCAYCGKQIHRSGLGMARWAGYLVLALVVAGGVGFYYFHQPPVSLPGEASKSVRRDPVKVRPLERQIQPATQTPTQTAEVTPLLKVAVGAVVLNDITGQQLARIPAAVLAGGWAALPKRTCLGGYDWQFQTNGQPPQTIEDGFAADDDLVGLWRLGTVPEQAVTPLVAWRTDRPLSWIALTGTSDPSPVVVTSVSQGTHFARVQIDTDVFEAGVFIQDESVVGWTFGDLIEGAFLWIGPDGSGRVPDLRIDDFYRITFANSREEEFLRALAPASEYSDLERLVLLAGAFRFESRLDPRDLIPELRPEAIIKRMRALIDSNLDAGLAVEVAEQFDAETLSRVADPNLIMDVVRANAAGYGLGSAVVLLENTLELQPVFTPAQSEQLPQVRAELHRLWLTNLIQTQDLAAAEDAFEIAQQRLPDDLYLHLLGVELALAQGDWSEAERLLAMKNYPPDLSAEVAGLQAQVLSLKAQAGSIVIRFAPGSRQIPVVATLDVGIRQQFIIDTGASMTTIPSDTARDLGLIINVRTPRRTIYTAGGVITAPEVVLPSIAIDDWEVRNIKALVVDLPNELGLGLLGMNYLRRFRMDLNSDDGLLLLEPR